MPSNARRVARRRRVIEELLEGGSVANFRFSELCSLLASLGFKERIRGSHHIFTKSGVEELINLQESRGGKAKPYQVRQVRAIILKYKLGEPE